MRLHLVIQRHGLPVTRILWTTAPPSLLGQTAPGSSAVVPAASSAIASTRTPNALYANGGYTIAQLLEDVNGVIPLETEPTLFDSECSGQWGLEDYVVEVAGSECLHFMEVEGLLRDGDEVLIRALQLSDLRARRLSGRHQISTDGRHLIDGVPFGKPFLKRPTSSRPAITIPPRKKRRTSLVSWGDGPAGYEEEDTEWAPGGRVRSFKELSALRAGSGSESKPDDDEYEDAFQDDYEDFHQVPEDTGDGTVIRYNVDQNDDQASESDADISDFDAGDLTEELKDLKEDTETSGMPESEKKADDEQAGHGGYSLRKRTSLHQAPRPSILQNAGKKIPDADASRRDSKAVRFEGQKEPSPPPPLFPTQKSPVTKQPEEVDSAAVQNSSSSSSSSSSSDESSDSSSDNDKSSSPSDSSDSDSSDSDSDSSSDSDDSASESELEGVSGLTSKTNPPGLGSVRTKKSNQRNKMRRRLAKLKELGALPAEADFAALRDLEEKHGGSYRFPAAAPSSKESEQTEFEAKRQKLLRDLESGGIDITEKENVPPGSDKENNQVNNQVSENANEASPGSKRRTLDVASSRRLLFGSLGVRTPRTKEDEEATRKKLAGKVRNNVTQKVAAEEVPIADIESDSEENWEDKLLIRATECIFDDVELTAPPFPFEQRWDAEAGDIIRQRKGYGKKRKRKQRIQVYDGQEEEEEYYGNDDYWPGDEDGLELNYDDTEQPNLDMEGVEQTGQEDTAKSSEETGDLPEIPDDLASLGDLVEGDLKKGSVIAFKQLDMSKATNWQPTVSEYRVASIHEVFEDQVLKLQLAKRDWRQPKEVEDDEDEPEYSGFEMPGFDDDEAEDDGFREVSFSDLIDPKLLRAASAAGGPGDAEKASFSPPEPPQRSPTPDAKADEKAPPEDRPLTQEDPDPLTKDAVDAARASGEDSSFGVKSPEFHGFQSSDEELGSASPGHSHSPQANHEAGDDDEDPNSGVRLSEPSTPPSTVPQNRSENEAAPLPTGSGPDLEMISSPESFESFNRLIASLFDNKVGIKKSPTPVPKAEKAAEQKSKTEPNGGKEQEQAQDEPESARPASRSSACSVVPNPFYEVDRAYEEQQRRNSTKTKNSLGAKDGDTTMDYLSAIEYASSPASRQSPTSAQRPSSPTQQEESLISAVPETLVENPPAPEDDALPPPDSQMSSQVIDLTQSSPLVSPDGSDEDFARSHRLPRGPGWVQKNIPPTRRVTRHSLGGRRRLASISPPAPRRRGKNRR
ncbi:hypothetical protein P170DRAFT_437186 [Aspergillus steynii IBT 23096]|uniref:Uncharacterized protein n=1 Tax=Aspergillus steynii IBT 23096 TaxID=1392250 RepID=A0A2I2G9P9_9EURO|nr:uncharacterized protein P170DRAFT_437186 [Aspergillus steynii IBT 23096]PLB49602.1 hypothetical protein P170DRAFT_437186 [Aspergillus steynii IBT 23096]